MWRSGLSKVVRPGMTLAAAFLALFALSGMVVPAASEDNPGAAASKAHLEDGKAALADRAYDIAVLQFERAITTDPRNARAFAWLGFAHQEAGNPDKALKYYRLALDIDPGDVKALLWNGQMDVEGKNLEAARDKLQRMARVCTRKCEEYRTLENSIRMMTARLEHQ